MSARILVGDCREVLPTLDANSVDANGGQASAAVAFLDQMVSERSPARVYALFSGGHDSLASTWIASQAHQFDGVIHINTRTGIEETREFVHETARRHGWPLLEAAPPEGTYEARCLRFGMPGGPVAHQSQYHVLKAQPLRQLLHQVRSQAGLPRTARIALVTGLRRNESARRMRLHSSPIVLDQNRIWLSPIFHWSGIDCGQLIEVAGLARNPVVDRLHRSGECLCGALADPAELEWIEFWYPEVGRRIKALEHECFKRGLPCRWGRKPTLVPSPAQPMLPLCASCQNRWEDEVQQECAL